MSEPRAGTGREVQASCKTCAQTVTHREHIGLYGGAPELSAVNHRAPCGAHCLGGGVRANVYRKKEVHGAKMFPCPRCPQ